ncbi:hypothetical protein ETD86_45545 [Nonomuraea turkmeniaca]|uniref:DUF937 domain-containing protein n=1 Tax=Nonomuraea turkmeniaca TaxID=103838 RepID=A0A5S4FIT8_9ACTN|nr:hypothetical protein [Nonomuraea turkmeniaca]TMR08967.1 hypothetical protein ETD86_45545 [Nonomuraea turkmeniaca]
MNRVVKAAVAVTAFGLAAALAVPAQAEVQYNTARYAPTDGLGEGANLAGSPLGGLLSGVTGGGLLGGLLGGIAKPKSADAAPATSSGRMTEAERDAVIAAQGRSRAGADPNAAEDVTRLGGPLPELSPIVSQLPLGGGGLTESLPVLSGAARFAKPATPSAKTARQRQSEPVTAGRTARDTFGSVGGMVDSYVQGAVTKLSGTGLLADTGATATGSSIAAADTMSSATKGFESLTSESMLARVGQAAKNALPSLTQGEVSPMVGRVAPAEVAPVVEALPGTTQTATMDELTPLVEEASGAVSAKGTAATGAYSDLMTALGWTSSALTSSVRDSWVHE